MLKVESVNAKQWVSDIDIGLALPLVYQEGWYRCCSQLENDALSNHELYKQAALKANDFFEKVGVNLRVLGAREARDFSGNTFLWLLP
jgi:hypothetical protein